MKTIYISGPISDPETGQPREGWQGDFLDAEQKLRRMGFSVVNPVDIAREVDSQRMYRWEYVPQPCDSKGNPLPPSRADYIMACLERMKMNHTFGRLDGVYVIGVRDRCRASIGVNMEVELAFLLGVPVYAEYCYDQRVDIDFDEIPGGSRIEDLLKD